MARPNNSSAISRHVKGLREAKAAFQALPDVVREALLEATEITAREIARNAQARILASPSMQTRALHDHIGWSLTKSNGRGKVGVKAGSTAMRVGGRSFRVRGIVTAGAGGSASKAAGARVVIPARYAHLVEFGARHMPAEPFMLPAANAEKNNYLARVKRAGKDIERDASRIGGGLL